MVPQNVTLNCSGFCNSFCPRKLNCCGKNDLSSDDDSIDKPEDKKAQEVVQQQLSKIKEPLPEKKIAEESKEKTSGCIIV